MFEEFYMDPYVFANFLGKPNLKNQKNGMGLRLNSADLRSTRTKRVWGSERERIIFSLDLRGDRSFRMCKKKNCIQAQTEYGGTERQRVCSFDQGAGLPSSFGRKSSLMLRSSFIRVRRKK